jgi:hypothetical protein
VAQKQRGALSRGAWSCFLDESGCSLRPPTRRPGRRAGRPRSFATVATEAGLHGRELLLPTGRVAGPAVLSQPARQLQRPHPDRCAQAAAPLLGRRPGHLDLGQSALSPPPGDGRLAGDPGHWRQVEYLPGYAHDLDPVEGLWANLKGLELANLGRDTIGEVLDAARQGSLGSAGSPRCCSHFYGTASQSCEMHLNLFRDSL